MAKSSEHKVNLDLLKRLVAELESGLNLAETFKIAGVENKTNYIVEMSKATGLATNIMSEATLLIGDIQMLCHMAQGVGAEAGSGDLLKILTGGLPKAPKGAGGSN